jgi:uncharacterized FAD-dependent dehydrogenase
MKEFEMTGRIGKDLRPDDVRIVAARELMLRGNAVINVIDPTKSFQPSFPNADYTCVIAKRSIDARDDVVYRYKIEVYDNRRESYHPYEIPEYKDVHDAEPVIIVGAGPAGLFAALKLLTLGRKPIILERGKDVHERKFDMAKLSKDGILNPDSNYCYGEGGAGAFSDGKLYTRSSKRGDIREVLYQFVNFGANRQILVDAHAHIGSDRLPMIVENIRKCIMEHGGEYHFGTKVTDITRKADGTLTVKALDSQNPTKAGKPSTVRYSADKVILATGHSARDIYDMFASKGWTLEAKGFAMGVRVEHSQAAINEIRYHGQWKPEMPAAEYSFSKQVDGRGVYSFCMCPGGILVPSATDPETIVMNGMSNSSRSGRFANAGAVVQINPEDVPEEYQKYGAFAGLEWQHSIEHKMWEYVQGKAENPMAAPAQRMKDFCNGVVSADLPETSYKPGVVSAPLHELLPEYIAKRLQVALKEVFYAGRRVKKLVDVDESASEDAAKAEAGDSMEASATTETGASEEAVRSVSAKISADASATAEAAGQTEQSTPAEAAANPESSAELSAPAEPEKKEVIEIEYDEKRTMDALLVGVESRTSSPIRIPRNPKTYQADALPGLYPAGEGAGYSGGIVSSAIDGINCAVAAVTEVVTEEAPEAADETVETAEAVAQDSGQEAAENAEHVAAENAGQASAENSEANDSGDRPRRFDHCDEDRPRRRFDNRPRRFDDRDDDQPRSRFDNRPRRFDDRDDDRPRRRFDDRPRRFDSRSDDRPRRFDDRPRRRFDDRDDRRRFGDRDEHRNADERSDDRPFRPHRRFGDRSEGRPYRSGRRFDDRKGRPDRRSDNRPRRSERRYDSDDELGD